MANTSRVARGRDSQRIVARLFQAWGCPAAQSVGAFEAGADVLNVGDISVEVKARNGFDPLAWLRQTRAAARKMSKTALPCVIIRPNGMGESTIDEWPVLLRAADFMQLLVDAGRLPGKDIV
jgi:hypothetical protein